MFISQDVYNFVISHMRMSRLQNNTLIISHCLSYAVRENSSLTQHTIDWNRIDNRNNEDIYCETFLHDCLSSKTFRPHTRAVLN